MKTIIRSVLVAFFVCGGVLCASAQTQEQIDYMRRNSDLDAAAEFQTKLENQFQENYARALDLARQNGWPLTKKNDDGSFSELQGVFPDGTPKYYTTSNAGSAKTSRVNRINPGGVDGLNLDGTGMLAGVWDQGQPNINHVDLIGRIGKADNSFAALAEHSTHVMGTILSSGVNKALAKGMAYNANGIWADWTNDLAEMQAAVTKKGLLLSNHSYGLQAGQLKQWQFGAYDQGSSDIDHLLFINPFYQPCWAAGNDRDQYTSYNSGKGGHDLLTSEAVAKNVIVVAAVKEVPTYTDATSVVMSVFSNWGPTDDNRIKPDISDKGVQVFSTLETSPTAYGYLDGTSMATPGVVGALVLIQQHYGNVYPGTVMRSATLRGLLAHTADEAGSYAGPDSKFGWGLINAERMAKTITNSVTQNSIMNELTLTQGTPYTTTVNATGTEPLVVSISWTDKEGPINNGVADPTTLQLINDLDVRVTKDGVTSYPWKLNSGLTNLDKAAAKNDNKVDNIEKIEVANTVAGTYTITVTNKGTLVGKNSLGTPTQDFSLIVTGIAPNLGIEQNDFKEFNVWPNPVKDMVNVSIRSDFSEEAFVTLYDIQGRRIINQKLVSSNDMMNGTLNTDSLTTGIYLIKVTQGNKQSVRKLVKE